MTGPAIALGLARADDPPVRAAISLAMLFGAACQPVTAIDPPSSTAQTQIIVVASGTAVDKVIVVEGAQAPSFVAHDGDILYALMFTCGPARLGLTPGTQTLRTTSADRELLPPPAQIFEASFISGATNTWALRTDLPPYVELALRLLPLADDARCNSTGARYEPKNLDLPSDGHGPAAYLIPLDATTALAGTHNGYLYKIDVISGEVERLPQLERSHDNEELEFARAYHAGGQASDGTLWMVDAQGGVFHGTIDTGFTSVTSTLAFGYSTQRKMAAALSQGDAPFELFLSSEQDQMEALSRFDGERWTRTATTPEVDTVYLPAVVWVGPGEAVSVEGGASGPKAFKRYRNGTAIEELSPSDTNPSAILHHPELGTVAGTNADGFVVDRGDHRWERLAGAPDLYFVRVMTREGAGFLYAGSIEINFIATGFGQYQPSSGFCRDLVKYTDFAAVYMAPVGEHHLVVLTAANFDTPMGVTVLTRTQEATSCSEMPAAPSRPSALINAGPL